MSYEEAQLEVAKKYDFDKWDECISEAYINNEFRVMYDTDPHKLFMEVAEIYANAKAKAKWNEGADEQLLLIRKHLARVPNGYEFITLDNAPKPEFKP